MIEEHEVFPMHHSTFHKKSTVLKSKPLKLRLTCSTCWYMVKRTCISVGTTPNVSAMDTFEWSNSNRSRPVMPV